MSLLIRLFLSAFVLFAFVANQAVAQTNLIRAEQYFSGPLALTESVYDIHGEVSYIGSGTFESVYMHYQINDNEVVSTFFDDINVQPNIPFYYQAQPAWEPEAPGEYEVRIWFSGVNGASVDEVASDTLYRMVGVYDDLPERKLTLLESFSSVNCGSCAMINPDIRDMIAADDDYAMVFYHPFSYENSPLYAFNPRDHDIRRDLYGVTYTPFAVVGNIFQGGTEFLTDSIMDMELDKPAGHTIDGTYYIEEDTLTVDVETTAFIALEERPLRLYVVLTEDSVSFEEPPGYNGESTFYHVNRKFLPDASGLSLKDQDFGDVFSASMVYDLSHGQIDTTGIEVIAFIQDEENLDVYQAIKLAYEAPEDDDETSIDKEPALPAVTIYPNPADGPLTISMDGSGRIQNVAFFDLKGRRIHHLENISQQNGDVQLTIQSVPDGLYILQIDTSNGVVHRKLLIER